MKDNIMKPKTLEHSDFGEIRTIVDENGTPMFCGSDVANALGYTNSRAALQRHCKGVMKRDTLTAGGIQEMAFIYEPDLYRLLIKSKLPAAQEFERWVFEDVLPSLRKYGVYATDELLENEEKLLEMAEKLKSEKSKLFKLSKENILLQIKNDKLSEMVGDTIEIIKVKNEVIENQKVYVDYVDYILDGDLDMTPTQIAADYDISAIKLNKLLHSVGLQRKVNGQWILYKKFMDEGYTNTIASRNPQNNKVYVQTLWTQKGRLLIHAILTDAGHYPNSKGVF